MGRERRLDPSKGPPFQFRMAPVECAHAHGKGKLEAGLAGQEDKILRRHAAKVEPAGRHLRRRTGPRRGNGLGGAVYGKDHALFQLAADKAGGNARTAADLEDPHAGPEGQGGYGLGDTG